MTCIEELDEMVFEAAHAGAFKGLKDSSGWSTLAIIEKLADAHPDAAEVIRTLVRNYTGQRAQTIEAARRIAAAQVKAMAKKAAQSQVEFVGTPPDDVKGETDRIRVILVARLEKSAYSGLPCVGDYVKPRGARYISRAAYVDPDGTVQPVTYSDPTGGEDHGGFYLGCPGQYSGSLEPPETGIFVMTGETKKAAFWKFPEGRVGAGEGRSFKVRVPVWEQLG